MKFTFIYSKTIYLNENLKLNTKNKIKSDFYKLC